MTPEEYITFNNCKPLTKKELKKGKNSLKIYGTDELMPWTEVYTYISIGKSMDDLAEKYGHGRKIALWAVKDNVQFIPTIADAFEGELEQRNKMKAIGETSPVVYETIMDAANEYAPDLATNVAKFSDSLIQRATKLINKDDCSSSDILNCAKAVQTATDVTGHTQRHASSVNIGSVHTAPEGFFFVEDKPLEAITEAELVEEGDKDGE